MDHSEKYDLIVKEIEDLLQNKVSSEAQQKSVLKYIKMIGASPIILNHIVYKSHNIILFRYEKNLFCVKVFGSQTVRKKMVNYSSMEALSHLDINNDKHRRCFSNFLYDLYSCSGYVSELSFINYIYSDILATLKLWRFL